MNARYYQSLHIFPILLTRIRIFMSPYINYPKEFLPRVVIAPLVWTEIIRNFDKTYFIKHGHNVCNYNTRTWKLWKIQTKQYIKHVTKVCRPLKKVTFSKYLVCEPLLEMTASSFRGIESTKWAHVPDEMDVHSSWMPFFSFAILGGLFSSTFIFKSFHKCSIGFKSGDILGHGSTFTFSSDKNLLAILDVCFGSLSSWNLARLARHWGLSTS